MARSKITSPGVFDDPKYNSCLPTAEEAAGAEVADYEDVPQSEETKRVSTRKTSKKGGKTMPRVKDPKVAEKRIQAKLDAAKGTEAELKTKLRDAKKDVSDAKKELTAAMKAVKPFEKALTAAERQLEKDGKAVDKAAEKVADLQAQLAEAKEA